MFKVTHDIKYIESLLTYSKDEQDFKANLEKIINEGIFYSYNILGKWKSTKKNLTNELITPHTD